MSIQGGLKKICHFFNFLEVCNGRKLIFLNFGVPCSATFFLFFMIEPGLGAGTDPVMALTPFYVG
jgi:hypothetical protein